MSKRNLNVILKNGFEKFHDLAEIYINFKKKLNKFRNKSFIVAISGGPDSLALAALSKAASYQTKSKFHYVLVNHNLRKNSTAEAHKVKSLLNKHQIKLKIFSYKEKIKKNIQSQARKARYEILQNYSNKKKINIIITAHHLEDQVETFFIRLSRGSGLKGLSAMKTFSKLNYSTKIFRPLLNTNKHKLIKISKKVFGKFIEDPSNKDEKYLRTKIRNLKKHLTKSGINYDQIIRSINNLSSSEKILSEHYKSILRDNLKKSKNKISVDLEKFRQFNDQIKTKIINVAIKNLKNNYYDIRHKKVANLVRNIKSKNFNKATLGGCIFFIKKDELCVKKE